MTTLSGHLPPLRHIEFSDIEDRRRPPLSTQFQWIKAAARTEQYQVREMFLTYTSFKIVSRQKEGGPAELIRMVLAYGGIEYKDEVIPNVDAKALIQKTPYGRMPVLWINHKAYGEPNAIVRHMASHVGLLGHCLEETLMVETITLQVENLRDSDIIQKAFEELSRNRADDNSDLFLEELMPTNFAEWDAQIVSTPGPYVVASGLSLADMAVYDFVTQHRKFFPLDEELRKHKSLLYLCTLVPKHPSLGDFIRSRFSPKSK